MLADRQTSEPAARGKTLSIRTRWLLFAGIGAVTLGVALLVLGNGPPPVVYAFTVHEALARHARGEEPHEALRIAGELVPGSLIRSDQSREVSFQMRSPPARDQLLFVRATCIVPISERDARGPVELWVQGRWSEGEGAQHFVAELVGVRTRYEMIERRSVPNADAGRAQQ